MHTATQVFSNLASLGNPDEFYGNNDAWTGNFVELSLHSNTLEINSNGTTAQFARVNYWATRDMLRPNATYKLHLHIAKTQGNGNWSVNLFDINNNDLASHSLAEGDNAITLTTGATASARIRFIYNQNNDDITYTFTNFSLVDITGDSLLTYVAEVVSATDYSPFGAPLSGRTWYGDTSNKYRFHFNGKETDNEVYGEGNCIAYELRIYDPRVGRFNSIDPRQREYPWQSTYAYYMNSPTSTVDFKGGGGPYDPEAAGEVESSIGNSESTGSLEAPQAPTEQEKKSVKDLKLSPEGKAFIASWEQGPKGGPALSIYDDKNPKATYKEGDKVIGFLTIGWGHRILPGEDFSKGITPEQADALLISDINTKAINPILRNVTAEMTQQQFDALVSYVFNTGSLKKTQLLEKLNNEDYANAVNEMDINTSEGEFMQGLENRRIAERAIWNYGTYVNH